MKKLAVIFCIFILSNSFFKASGQEDPTGRNIKLNGYWKIEVANINVATRIGVAAGPYPVGLNIAPFGKVVLSTRRTTGWYGWIYRPTNPFAIDKKGNYLQFALGKSFKLGKYIMVNPNISWLIPQNENFLAYEKTYWIYNVLTTIHLNKRSSEKKEVNTFSVWVNRFQNVNNVGSNWDYRLEWKKSIKHYGILKLNLWYNQGMFNKTPGLSSGITLESRKLTLSKKVFLKARGVVLINVTRKEGVLTRDAGVIGFVVEWR